MRSRAPPVADAARRSTRSGRKERASEQREVLFGYRKAEGANTPWLPLERICAQYGFVFSDYLGKNNIRIQHSLASKGFAKGKAWFPFALFCFLLQEQKEGPRGER